MLMLAQNEVFEEQFRLGKIVRVEALMASMVLQGRVQASLSATVPSRASTAGVPKVKTQVRRKPFKLPDPMLVLPLREVFILLPGGTLRADGHLPSQAMTSKQTNLCVSSPA